jgi:hypothetical protein
MICRGWITSYDKDTLEPYPNFYVLFKTTSSVLLHRLSVSFWFFLLRAGWLWLPVRGFRGLVLAGALGLLFWHHTYGTLLSL